MNAWKIGISVALLAVLAFIVWRRQHPTRKWVVSKLTYEGFPLLLRRPTNLDTPANRERYPILAVVTHEFTHRYPDGRPEPAYNESLLDFDCEITSAFDSPQRGIPILIETFGGKRIYYFYVEPGADLSAVFQPIAARHSNEKLTWELSQKGWGFIDRYAGDFFPSAPEQK